ncbi:MAG: DPP IV N-terminal domain-containing protein [Anaerolineae bacterium]|nr:DPP IV N-terminal domain-containing protein [Anaerolineae bacterium]
MNKKRLTRLIIGVVILLASGAVSLGLYTQRTRQVALQPSFAFASDRSGAGDIFVSDQHGDLHNVTNDPGADWDPTWSPDGKLLAFTGHRDSQSDIWLLDLSRLEQTDKLANLTNDPAWDYSPSWSPSGQSVAFVSERDGDPEIFIQNLEGDSAIQLTFNQEMERLPAWSPDGQHIAFAAVRDGVEKIYRIRPDGTDEQLITPHPLQGTAPAWSPDSQRLAFVGWNEDNKAGIYIVGPEIEDLEQVFESTAWIGSLDWSADGRWLTFTSWESGNHELYALALNEENSPPIRLTFDDAWDDFLALHPVAPFAPAAPDDVAQAAEAGKLPPHPDFVTGVNMADLGLAYLVNDMGFDWAKGFVNWGTVETEPGEFRWVDPDNIVKAFGDQQVNILMRVHGTPPWARPADSHYSHPPRDLDDFANFLTALATRYKGQVAAYEIWNEPNLSYEWGYLVPDPVAYTEMLKVAYAAIKKADPEALVISGGLATTGDGSDDSYGDLAFLEAMYQAGAKGHFDAFGSHPYAYGLPPDQTHPGGLALDRVMQQHELMQAHGDGRTPIWITEIGWVLESSWDLGEHQKIGVSQQLQGQYLPRSYAKIQEEWPFVEAVFLFNLDFSTVAWYPAAEPMRWYAILNPDRTPRPAYTSLREVMRQR